MRKSAQFQRVFADARRIRVTGFTVLYRDNDLSHARLGLAIAKKCARLSVQRQRLKRVIRESFRLNQHELPAVDIVVLCARGATETPNRELFAALGCAWNAIGEQTCGAS